ncbi:uncharacterized protein LOC130934022 [Arachis stenosperma]|uniref:uncharacterized protein LOC130934022 n=1 Tax=Arachis stenosperma TaxID=217475 RepID=UPI0025ABA707|nr:uncharacterized protein LOC130934022 [Arachis stenosperma]
MITLTVKVGSSEQNTVFMVVPSKGSYNVLLGRDWIHGVGAVPSTVHQSCYLSSEGLSVKLRYPDLGFAPTGWDFEFCHSSHISSTCNESNASNPMADLIAKTHYMLIDSAAGNKILSFMDGYSGYNQIFIAEDDVSKTAFRCPGALGTYEWVVMPFGLKNADATYQ